MKRYIHSNEDHEDWYDENGERHPWFVVHVDLDKRDKELREDPKGRKAWSLLDRKDVRDYDGFWTNYSLYFNKVTNEYVTVFGDPDIYRPENGDTDAEFDNEEEAWEFFYDYKGYEDEEE